MSDNPNVRQTNPSDDPLGDPRTKPNLRERVRRFMPAARPAPKLPEQPRTSTAGGQHDSITYTEIGPEDSARLLGLARMQPDDSEPLTNVRYPGRLERIEGPVSPQRIGGREVGS